MRSIRHIAYLMLSIMCFACTSDNMEMTQSGGFCLALNGDATVATRMTPAELGAPIASRFNVKITNDKTGRVVYDGQYKEFVSAGNGDYTLEAAYGQNVELGLNSPYYYGEAQASITASDLTPAVVIPCRVANSLLSVRYLDKDGNVSTKRFDENFSMFHVRLDLGNLSTELESRMDNSAYFRAGTMPKATFVGTLADTGREVEYEIPASSLPSALSAAEHLVLTLSLEVNPSGVILEVAKAEVENVTVEETVPLEWLPKPKVNAFGGDGQLNYIETTEPTEEAVINFATSHDLQDMELAFGFADEPLASALNGTYTLSTLTAEQSALLESYGLALPKIGNRYSDGKLDLRGMVRHLLTHDGETVDNTVAVRVKANDRWSSDEPQQFTISAVRPVFRMAEQSPGYAWAHSMYIAPLSVDDIVDAKGANPQDLVASAVYDISTDGGTTWTEVSDVQDGLHFIDGLAANTAYMLRARIGSVMTSATNVTVRTENEAGVPNGDFEDLSQTLPVSELRAGNQYKIRFIFTGTYTNYATFTVQEPNGWASVNGKTCNMSASVKDTWYQCPSTYNTTISWSQRNDFRKTTKNNPEPYSGLEAQSGSNAMVVRNVGWDNSGASISVPTYATPYYNTNVPNVKQRSSGKLFLGSYSYTGGKETYNEGASFASRPTVLKGYYKYIQDGDNTEYGTVTVTLLNGNTVLGTGMQNLTSLSGYGLFSVPITYTNKLLPATSLRIMFTSSRYASYVQSEETANVKASTYNGEYESCMRGATLTVDNLTFTYER